MAVHAKMPAMILESPGKPLSFREIPIPTPAPGQVLLQVHACGVCRTDLHIVDGELPNPKLPLILGHEIVGTVVATGPQVTRFQPGVRVGVPWLGRTCGRCRYCLTGRENLCDAPGCTGYTINGGNYCFPLTADSSHIETAPLLCAGLIGYRSYRLTGSDVEHLGIYGFGAAAHITAQVAIYHGQKVYAFTAPGDLAAQTFARSLGAAWAGDSTAKPPTILDAAIIFAPVGPLLPAALTATAKGGVVVCGGIHMSDIPSFPYDILWGERVVRSVANLTRQDGEEFLALAAKVPVKTEVHPFPLKDANKALALLRHGLIQGAAVLHIS